MEYKTEYRYFDRVTKAKYVWLKYKRILKGKILDVGADECQLRYFLPDETKYVGIGLDDTTDIKIDLEKEKIPFEDSSFDIVLCLDVLEHLDNLHEVFDELCRVSRTYVIISLPNCHRSFIKYLKVGNSNGDPHQHLKFYGIPYEKPTDRHKWFFSTDDAERFIQYRSKKNDMEIVQIDIENERIRKISVIEKLIFKLFFRKYSNFSLSNRNVYTGRLWAVLRKRQPDEKNR